MIPIPAFIRALKSGEEFANAATWKNRQALVTTITALLLAAAEIARACGGRAVRRWPDHGADGRGRRAGVQCLGNLRNFAPRRHKAAHLPAMAGHRKMNGTAHNAELLACGNVAMDTVPRTWVGRSTQIPLVFGAGAAFRLCRAHGVPEVQINRVHPAQKQVVDR